LLIGLVILSGTVRAQDEPSPPQAPQPANPPPQHPQTDQPQTEQPSKNEKPEPEKKEESSNPAQAAAEKTKDVTLEAAEATKNVGEAALVKVRDWERGWFVGVYVEKGRPLVPMSLPQRREIYLQQTLTTPGAYLKRMFAAGFDQVRGVPWQWDDGWGGYGERFASREGQFIAANSLAALGNAALRYEPRYDQCRCSGFWPRTRHAIMRNFLTYNQSEQELRPQWALYGGSFGGGNDFGRMETAAAKRLCRGRPRRGGAGRVRGAAEFLHRILDRHQPQDRRQKTLRIPLLRAAEFP